MCSRVACVTGNQILILICVACVTGNQILILVCVACVTGNQILNTGMCCSPLWLQKSEEGLGAAPPANGAACRFSNIRNLQVLKKLFLNFSELIQVPELLRRHKELQIEISQKRQVSQR